MYNRENYVMTTGETINYINEIKVWKDDKEINELIKELLIVIKKMLRESTQTKFIFKLIKILNIVLISKPGTNVSLSQDINDCLIKTLDDLKFEKEILTELKQYLKFSKKNKMYEDLDDFYILLIAINSFECCYKENYKNSINKWKNTLNEINPDSTESIEMNTEDLKQPIKSGLQKLKAKVQ